MLIMLETLEHCILTPLASENWTQPAQTRLDTRHHTVLPQGDRGALNVEVQFHQKIFNHVFIPLILWHSELESQPLDTKRNKQMPSG